MLPPFERLLLGVSRRGLLSAAGGLAASLAGLAAARRRGPAPGPGPGAGAVPSEAAPRPARPVPPPPPPAPPAPRRSAARGGARPSPQMRPRVPPRSGGRSAPRTARFSPRRPPRRVTRGPGHHAGEERSRMGRLTGALERIAAGGGAPAPGAAESASAASAPETAAAGADGPFFFGGGGGGGVRTAAAASPESFVEGGAPPPEPATPEEPSPMEARAPAPASEPPPSLPPPTPAGPVGPTVATPAARQRIQTLSFDPEVQLLAERLSFGPTPALVEEIETLGVEGWLEAQLAPETLDDAVADSAVAGLSTLALDNATRRERVEAQEAVREIRHGTLLRALTSRRQLLELMVDFWSNHLNVDVRRRDVAWLKASDDRDVIRPHALGRFADLLQASAKSPAMLVYLDNDKNRGSSPNENYGRELLELHTVGIEAGYSEDDVRSSARLLSGWRVREGAFAFEPEEHAPGPKQVMGFATAGVSGLADGEAYLDYLARHPATAARLARKLCVRFVADDPPAALVDAVAAAYRENDTAIVPTLRALFAHPVFRASGRAKLRRPFEVWMAMVRATGARVPLDAHGDGARSLHRPLEELAQPLFGQPPPTGYPDRREDWLSAAALLVRFEHAGELAQDRERDLSVDVEALWAGPPPPTVGEWVTGVTARLLARPVAAATWEALLAALGEPAAAPFDPELARARGPLLVGLILASADAQLR